MEVIESMVEKGSLKVYPNLSIDKKMEDLIMMIFSKRMGKWDRELGEMLSKVTEDKDHSRIFKGTTMYFFLRDFLIPKEYFRLIAF